MVGGSTGGGDGGKGHVALDVPREVDPVRTRHVAHKGKHGDAAVLDLGVTKPADGRLLAHAVEVEAAHVERIPGREGVSVGGGRAAREARGLPQAAAACARQHGSAARLGSMAQQHGSAACGARARFSRECAHEDEPREVSDAITAAAPFSKGPPSGRAWVSSRGAAGGAAAVAHQ